MYKNIIPSLISLDSRLKRISGFYLSDDFDFNGVIKEKNKFHYRIVLDNKIVIPRTYDFRNGYFFKKDDYWYYQRKFKNLEIKFCLDFKKRTFRFNWLYSLVLFEVGHIFPIGRHLADLINLELFLTDYFVFRGCAFIYKGKSICIIAPGLNGKTTLIAKMVKNGCQYLAEDMLIINLKTGLLYPCSPRSDLFAREPSRELGGIVSRISKGKYYEMVQSGVKINKIYLVQNVTNQKFDPGPKTFFDYLNLNSFIFNRNPFIRSFIFEEDYTKKVFDKLNNFRKPGINFEFKHVKNFDYDGILKDVLNEK